MDGAVITVCSTVGGFGAARGVGDGAGAAFLLCGIRRPAAVDRKSTPASKGMKDLIRPSRNGINGVPGSSSGLRRRSSKKNLKRHCTRGAACKALRKNFANHCPHRLRNDTV